MFKNAILYSITLPQGIGTAEDVAEVLGGRGGFDPCGPTQEKSCGWIPPRHEYSGCGESINGQLIAAFRVQTKAVPKDALNELVNAAAASVEAATGRKPGKKERRALADDALLELLPKAFPKTKEAYVWFDRAAGLLVIDTSSQSVADDVVTSLVNLFEGVAIHLINTAASPAALMTSWLHGGDDLDDADRRGFSLGRACTLKSGDEEKSQVSYKRHSLHTEEIREHINRGLRPTKVDLCFGGRIEFTLHDSLKLTGIKVLDVDAPKGEEVDAFETDFTIIAAELGAAIDALLGALGGIVERKE